MCVADEFEDVFELHLGLEDEFKLHLAEWNTVCSIIYWVWVTILGPFNEALLGKQL